MEAEKMEQEAPEQAEGAGGGDLMALVESTGQGLQKLGEALNGSPGTTDQDRAEMAQVMELFMGLVQRKLGGGEAEGPVPAEQGAVPAMGGAQGVPMGPQSRM